MRVFCLLRGLGPLCLLLALLSFIAHHSCRHIAAAFLPRMTEGAGCLSKAAPPIPSKKPQSIPHAENAAGSHLTCFGHTLTDSEFRTSLTKHSRPEGDAKAYCSRDPHTTTCLATLLLKQKTYERYSTGKADVCSYCSISHFGLFAAIRCGLNEGPLWRCSVVFNFWVLTLRWKGGVGSATNPLMRILTPQREPSRPAMPLITSIRTPSAPLRGA